MTTQGDRRARAFRRRNSAADLAANMERRPIHLAVANGDNTYYDGKPMAFSKGLLHDGKGRADQDALNDLIAGLTGAGLRAGEFSPKLDVETAKSAGAKPRCVPKDGAETHFGHRIWESPFAGHYYELEGPDPAAVAIAPAPRLGESELTAEMAEVYAMAVVRDMSFEDLSDPDCLLYFYAPDRGGSIDETIKVELMLDGKPATVADLNAALASLAWFDPKAVPVGGATREEPSEDLSDLEQRRRVARWTDGKSFKPGGLFRGSSKGCFDNGYISQFLLLGSKSARKSGNIDFGAQQITQKVLGAERGIDYMTSFAEWLDAQNGVNLSGLDLYATTSQNPPDGTDARLRKFIETPRDLATFVHIDQLYQAYFNACLLMLDAGVKPDIGFPNSDTHPNNAPVSDTGVGQTRTGFATFGGPHVLSLMTEVASRCLRAVRRQKFQVHLRARPERLAALITLAANDEWSAIAGADLQMASVLSELGVSGDARPVTPILDWIDQINQVQNTDQVAQRKAYKCTPLKGDFKPQDGKNYLLPMAFPEGSPMHPAYGAGHATVAGACVTILKAFFQLHGHAAHVVDPTDALDFATVFGKPVIPAKGGQTLKDDANAAASTIEGELNKLAANISIGRNFAGVHYYTDYYESLRLGERVAYGILQEQMLTYNEPVRLNFHSFDGDWIELQTQGEDSPDTVSATILDQNGQAVSEADWWQRGTHEFGNKAPAKAALVS